MGITLRVNLHFPALYFCSNFVSLLSELAQLKTGSSPLFSTHMANWFSFLHKGLYINAKLALGLCSVRVRELKLLT